MTTHMHLATTVELHVRCVGLPKLDLTSKSDPFVVIYAAKDGATSTKWEEIHRTSTIINCQDPEWPDQILVTYHFESVQKLKFEVYDRDSKSEVLSKHDFIGSYETTMSKIMGSRGCTVSGDLTRKKRKKTKKTAHIIVSGDEVSQDVNILHFTYKATGLTRKNMLGLGKSDPFYVISQLKPSRGFTKVFSSEVVKSSTNPLWKPQSIPVQRICGGDSSRELKVEVFDWESSGKHQYIGEFKTSLDELIANTSFQLHNEKSKKKKKAGTMTIANCHIEERYSFLQYIQGGCDLNLLLAVDFTGSNGSPTKTSSLHHVPPGFTYTGSSRNISTLNQYQTAIWSVGNILQDYDTDKKIPTFGFGGQISGNVNHCFPLNLNDQDPEVDGIVGVMEAYQSAIQSVPLSGPTYFSKVLKTAIKYAKEDSNTQKYTVLLILTDGVINDMDKSTKLIVEASSLPLSIIIVGVGNADFTNMEDLDADDQILSYNGRSAERDIVQFVPFNRFNSKGPTALAEEVLREVPEQMTGYFATKGIKPLPKVDAPLRHFGRIPEQVPVFDVPLAAVVVEDAEAGKGSKEAVVIKQ